MKYYLGCMLVIIFGILATFLTFQLYNMKTDFNSTLQLYLETSTEPSSHELLKLFLYPSLSENQGWTNPETEISWNQTKFKIKGMY